MDLKKFFNGSRLIFAVLVPFVALTLQLTFWTVFKPYAWFLFFPAVFLSSWLGGLGGGIFATLVSIPLAWWFFILPERSFTLNSGYDLIPMIIFLIMGCFSAIFQERLRQIRISASDALEAEKISNERLHEANKKISGLYKQTRELEQIKNNFFASVSHNLRTPLTLILIPVRKHLASGILNDEQKRDLQIVERNAQLLYRQVSDLLDVSRLESGRVLVEYARVDLAHLTRVNASHFEPVMNEKKLQYNMDVPFSLFVEVDAEKYQRVLMYLLSNVVKMAPENSQMHLTLNEHESNVLLCIELGRLALEATPRIVARFHSEMISDQDVDDLAMDLTIIREFIGLHQGRFTVEEVSETSLMICVSLPLKAPAGSTVSDINAAVDEEISRQILGELEPLPPKKEGAPSLSNASLALVVEDNPDMNAFIAEILGEHYRVIVAFNGREGLEKALEYEPDLIVSDVMMPIMDGDEMVRELRSHPSMLDVPVIMLTAKADDELRVRLLRDSVQDYLYKPFSVAELLARSERLISEKKRREASMREAYGLLHSLVDSIPDVIFVKDLQGRYLTINQAGSQLIDLMAEEIIGKTDLEIFPVEMAQHVMDEDNQIKNRAERITFEKKEIVGGKERYFLSTKAPFYDHQGQIAGVLGINRDISDIKLAEEKISKLNRVLAVLSNINQSIVRIRNLEKLFKETCRIAISEGGFLLACIVRLPADQESFTISAFEGPSEEDMQSVVSSMDLTGKLFVEMIRTLRSGQHRVCNNIFTEVECGDFGRCLTDMGIRSTVFLPLLVSDQLLGWISLCSTEVNFFDDEELKVLDEMAQDVSYAMEFADQEQERQKAELSLRLSEERYRSTLDNMMEGAQIIGFDWRYLYVNAMAAFWGRMNREELIGSTVMEKYPGFEQTSIYTAINNCMLQREIVTDEFEFVYEDGSHAWFDLSIQPLPEGVFILSLDITQRKTAEQALHSRLEELEVIRSISMSMRTAQTLREVLPIFLMKTLELIESDTGIIWLFEHDQEMLRAASAFYQGKDVSDANLITRPGEGIAGTVFQTGQSEFVDNLLKDSRSIILPKVKLEPGSGGAYMPISTDTELVGVLFILIPPSVSMDDQKKSLLNSLADMAGNTIHRMRLHDETVKRLERLKSLHVIDLAIATNNNIPDTMKVLVEQTIQQLNVDAADIMLYNSHKDVLEYMSGTGFESRLRDKIHVFSDRGVVCYTSLEHRIVQTVDLDELDQTAPFAEAMLAEGFKSYYQVPLMAKLKYLGVLEVFSRRKLNPVPEWLEFLEALAGQAAIALDNAVLFNSLQQAHSDLSKAYDETIEGWSHALDLRDKETEGHTQRVTELTLHLAREFDISEDDMLQIKRGCLLHDIGKMGVPDYILLKPGPLTDEEWVVMKKHPIYAYELITPIDYLKPAVDIPYCHHEKWDGSGYPRGLREEEIPLSARIFAVVDVWDALTSERPYRPAWSKEKTLEYIRSLSGKQFDPEVVRVFMWFMKNWGDKFEI